MPPLFTLDRDETGWTNWAERMANAPPSPLVEALLGGRQMDTGACALDLGCGTGRAFAPLANCGYRVFGLDPTMQALRYAHQRAEKESLPAYVFCAAADRLPLPGDSLEFVLAVGVIFHLTPIEQSNALREIHRILQPGGEALLHFLDLDDWRRALAAPAAPNELPQIGYKSILTCFYSQAEILDMVEGAGLQIQEIKFEVRDDDRGQRRNWLIFCQKPR